MSYSNLKNNKVNISEWFLRCMTASYLSVMHKGRVNLESLSEARNPFIEDAQDVHASPPV